MPITKIAEIVTASALASAVALGACLLLYLRHRERVVTEFCSRVVAGEPLAAVRARASEERFGVIEWPVTPNADAEISVGKTPFLTVTAYCCIRHRDGVVVSKDVCFSG